MIMGTLLSVDHALRVLPMRTLCHLDGDWYALGWTYHIAELSKGDEEVQEPGHTSPAMTPEHSATSGRIGR